MINRCACSSRPQVGGPEHDGEKRYERIGRVVRFPGFRDVWRYKIESGPRLSIK